MTLDDLATFSTEAYKLRELGTLTPDEPIPWIVSLGDLYVITDLLSNTGFVHYLSRREKLNRLGRVYAHDELDWLGHYFAEGLYFDEIFDAPDAPDYYRLLSFTDAIDAWYFAEDGVRTVATERPAIVYPDIVKELLDRLEGGRPTGFVAASCALRDWSFDSSTEFDAGVQASRRRATEQGWASMTLVFENYGLCWAGELEKPEHLQPKTDWLVQRDRGPDLERPLWIAVGDVPRQPLYVAVKPDGDDRAAAYQRAFLDPHRGLGAAFAEPPAGSTADDGSA